MTIKNFKICFLEYSLFKLNSDFLKHSHGHSRHMETAWFRSK